MPWAIPKWSKNEVDRAGAVITDPPAVPETTGQWTIEDWENWQAWERAYDVLNNWRSAHGYPLWVFQSTLKNKVNGVDSAGFVSQRLKRFLAIRLKLRLHSSMALSQMQDIGGCRAVVHSVAAVRELVDVYERGRLRHTLRRKTDYIERPRSSGYRAVHLIYRYRGRRPGPYDSLHVEMQIRTEIQHIWAMAVETVGTFLSQALKSSLGQEAWLRFFALMGSALALREGTSPVVNVPVSPKELMGQVRRVAQELQVEARLQVYNVALETVGRRTENARYFLLQLNANERTLKVTPFQAAEADAANTEYLRLEKEIASKPGNDAVLVSVRSLAALRQAYPSYFLDTARFLALLRETLA